MSTLHARINYCKKPKVNYRVGLLIIFLCAIACNALGLSLTAKQQYPFTLLTDDYGILNDHDLSYYIEYVRPATFFPKKEAMGYIYWQCFPRENISITLEDYGDFVKEFGKKDTIGQLEMKAIVKSGVFHEYIMKNLGLVKDFQKQFNSWRKLMKNEKYVCLAGSFISRSQSMENGIKRDVSGWTFERLKTKKGCVAYLNNDCNES